MVAIGRIFNLGEVIVHMKKHMVVLLAVVLLNQMTFAQSIGYTFTSEKDGVSCVFPDQHFVTDTTSYAPLVQHQSTAPDHSYVLIFQIKPPIPPLLTPNSRTAPHGMRQKRRSYPKAMP